MPQSLVLNYLHITFSTKNRQATINKNIQDELFRYLGGICNEHESKPVIVGGTNDHVHLLINLSRKIALMNLVEKLKSHSSKWIKTKNDGFGNFYWQRGYGCFSVNPKQLDVIKEYIQNQEEHHLKLTFEEENKRFLREYNLDYDERYVFD
ncbi:IS200/IS605 family transposase [Maribellus sediminis]|uniref:IS200/IS605 family transposase n=1 Tax=Maribellus sediminis TaxID=2696285 RepID=UPI00142FD92F|nr:IS200/IS605 family transposase [Maribellus sediminis]